MIRTDSINRPKTMRSSKLTILTALVTGLGAGACDFLDPTGVNNPTVTEETFLAAPNAATSWTHGVRRQLASAMNQVITGTEVVSDNVFNNRTLYSKVFDIPRIENSDFDVRNIQSSIHRLRQMADHGLTVVAPADAAVTDQTVAQLHFYRGFAHLLSAELFVALPGEPEGPALDPATHFSLAVQDFERARSLSNDADFNAAALLGIARAEYGAGNRAAAVSAARQVKSTAPAAIHFVEYDNVDGPGNSMQVAIYDSGQDEFQPLPRLDFLFPKYYSETAGDQSPVALLKGEEAFLILAEAALATGDVAEARTELKELLDLVATRPTALIDDRGQLRGRQGGTWVFPDNAAVLVAASPTATPRAGLVLTRSESRVEVPIISGTSVSHEMLDEAQSHDEMLYLLYLMRQEIFVVEGRRMTDLGIRLPVALDEALTNPNVDQGSAVLSARIPSFIPMDYGLDGFTYEDGDLLVVIHHDMNAVLVANQTSPFVLPFH